MPYNLSAERGRIGNPLRGAQTGGSAAGAPPHAARIDSDGLPHVGAVVWPKQSYYSTVDTVTGALLPPPPPPRTPQTHSPCPRPTSHIPRSYRKKLLGLCS